MLNSEEKDEFYFFKLRKSRPQRFYASKEFPFITFKKKVFDKKRYINNVILNSKESEFVSVNGEIILRTSFNGATQVRAVVYSNEETNTMNFTIQKFHETKEGNLTTAKESSFTFSQKEWFELIQFLNEVQFLDLSNKDRFQADMPKTPKKISLNLVRNLSDKEETYLGEEVATILNNLDEDQRKVLVELSQNHTFTKVELDILSGRKKGMDEFTKMMNDDKINEGLWQKFFESNPWIFGYGLSYKFLKILQREARVSSINVDGKDTVISDFLMSDKRFTSLVELKKPNTKLFQEEQNRSRSWRLSNDLTWAVSQILAQKAEWEIKSNEEQFDNNGNPITEISTDIKSILIIGHSSQFSGPDRESRVKAKTFELYRRNLRNIEILTFDELHDRAKFIINNNELDTEEPTPNKILFSEESNFDDLPF